MNMQDMLQGSFQLIIAIATYILMALPLFVLGQKTNQDNAWFAFVPILNLVLLIQIAGKELWWIILFLIPCVNWIVYIICWMAVCDRVNKPNWMGILCGIPCLHIIMPFVIAFT
jgi:hypothetical protein